MRGLLVCGECGRTLSGRSYANGTVRYYCTNRGSSRSLAQLCSCPPVDGGVVEPLIWQAVTQLLTNPHLILDYYLSHQDEQDDAPQKLERVRRELDQLAKQEQRLLDAYQAGVIELDELDSRRQVLHQQH
ncbi:MAG: recombinase zinc beta ribbon domain-containing protein [Anaerolineae bacterium]